MSSLGRAHRKSYEVHLRLQGATVYVHDKFGTPETTSLETRGLKEFEEHNRRQVVFRFPKAEEIHPGNVLQIKGGRDFWRVTDTEDIIEGDVYVYMEVLVEKINEAGQKMRLNAEGRAVYYTTNIQGDNYGGLQQGGQNNTQTNIVTINPQFEEATNKILAAIEQSQAINPIQKIKVKGDIQVLKELAPLEKTPEVVQEANTRIGAIQSVLSTTADLVSLGMVVIPILRAAFGG